MSTSLLLLIIVLYFSLLLLISRYTSRHSQENTFFDGDRRSPWFLVAFGMIGSGISAVSLVSIPGNVGNDHLYYFQFILGSIAGYLFIAFVLLPVFYKLRWYPSTNTWKAALVRSVIKQVPCSSWYRSHSGQPFVFLYLSKTKQA